VGGRAVVSGGATLAAFAIAASCSRSELIVPDEEESMKRCDQFSAVASLSELDVYLLLDSSGSMDTDTALGITKWQAVKTAISEFLVDPIAEGAHVGINFFPFINQGVPVHCQNDEQCNMQEGACMPLGLCRPSETSVCSSNNQCPLASDHCERLGQCESSPDVFCQLSQGSCGGLGECMPAGFCENRSSCDSEDYRVRTLARLPEQADTILQALEARQLDGYTPTLPALLGLARSAAEHSSEHPRNKTVIVLATDGLPTSCDPELVSSGVAAGVQNLVEVAESARGRSVETFVIGVFAPDEAGFAQENLDTLARAGGTGDAFVITTDAAVSELFRQALEEVRRSNVCEFALPDHASDLDLTKMKVRISRDGEPAQWVDYVGGKQNCGDAGGFYYDLDPEGDIPPGRAILCPASCATRPDTILITCAGQVDPIGPRT
jgi:Mg-chelatase subunit ChlD